MPDIFTPLLVLVLALLVLAPERLSVWERSGWWRFAAFMIAAHQSHVPLAVILLLVLLPLRRFLGAGSPLTCRGMLMAVAPPLLAVIALMTVNAVGFGRVRHVAVSATCSCWRGSSTTAPGWTCCGGLPRGRLAALRLHRSVSADLGRIPVARGRPGGAGRRRQDRLRRGRCDHRDGAASPSRATMLRRIPDERLAAARDSSPAATGLEPWPTTVTPWIERGFPARRGRRLCRRRARPRGRSRCPLAAGTAWRDRAARRRRLLRRCCLLALRRRNAMAGFAAGGSAGAAGQCGDHRRPLRAARSLPEPHHVAAGVLA